MRSIVAVCTPDYEAVTRSIVGERAGLLLSPPWEALRTLSVGHPDALYVDLHGQESGRGLYDALGRIVVAADAIRAANLGGAVVFTTACYAVESGIVAAFLAGGARAVIAGRGPNYTCSTRYCGAGLLALHFFSAYRFGLPWRWALYVARAIVCVQGAATEADREAAVDALRFEAHQR